MVAVQFSSLRHLSRGFLGKTVPMQNVGHSIELDDCGSRHVVKFAIERSKSLIFFSGLKKTARNRLVHHVKIKCLTFPSHQTTGAKLSCNNVSAALIFRKKHEKN